MPAINGRVKELLIGSKTNLTQPAGAAVLMSGLKVRLAILFECLRPTPLPIPRLNIQNRWDRRRGQ
jgi:hypothetical protein